ncbi:hypothetical protein BDY19DRAFT_976122 [Irpex rosettiformis]|uniref:Uncharacterized protein n=1 Tax=Irpex rosettiformis TaxID=378272 RepID=A0ACB8TPK3_9APHY|nr:hypothetical protein BDY19DRAFT_976122 [Irpex rosettiformis]
MCQSMSVYTGPGRTGHCLQYISDAHNASHRTLPKIRQGFGVGQTRVYNQHAYCSYLLMMRF